MKHCISETDEAFIPFKLSSKLIKHPARKLASSPREPRTSAVNAGAKSPCAIPEAHTPRKATKRFSVTRPALGPERAGQYHLGLTGYAP